MSINPSSVTSLVREVISNTYARTMRFDFKTKERIKVLIGEKTLNCLLLTNANGVQIACTTLRESVGGISAYHVCYIGYQTPPVKRHQEENIFGHDLQPQYNKEQALLPEFPCVMVKGTLDINVYNKEDYHGFKKAGFTSIAELVDKHC